MQKLNALSVCVHESEGVRDVPKVMLPILSYWTMSEADIDDRIVEVELIIFRPCYG